MAGAMMVEIIVGWQMMLNSLTSKPGLWEGTLGSGGRMQSSISRVLSKLL